MRVKFSLNKALVLFVLTLLAGCSSSPSNTTQQASQADRDNHSDNSLAHFPADAYGNTQTKAQLRSNGILDLQYALADRHLYKTKAGNISLLNQSCGIDVIARRGHVDYPENSVSGVKMAAFGDYDGAAINARLTRDNYWIAHADERTGRAVGRTDGEQFKLSRLDGSDWNSLLVRDKSGTLIGERPAYLVDILKVWRFLGSNEQPLNIEIMGEADVSDLARLDKMVRGQLGAGSYFYSSKDFSQLKQLRALNSKVYLGYVWEAHPTSVNVLRSQVTRAVGSDALFQQNQRNIAYLDRREDRARNKRRASAHNAAYVRRYLGSNSGLHVDIRSYQQYPTIQSRSRKAGLRRVSTYSINGADYHGKTLRQLHKAGRVLPNEAIIDSTKYVLCSQLEPGITAAKKRYKATTPLGRVIAKLPNDADFSRLDTQVSYVENGHYLTHYGKVRQLPVGPSKLTSSKRRVSNKAQPAKSASTQIVEDVAFELMAQPIQITIPN
jgi:glycerophosphoryl diester phosphodiesterase